MKPKITARIISLLLALLLLQSSFAVTVSAYSNAYLSNARFHSLSASQATSKYLNGEKFILFCYRESCTNSQAIGSTAVTSWMNDYKYDIYGVNIDVDNPSFIWYYLKGTTLPFVLFVNAKNAKAHSLNMYSSLDNMQAALFCDFFAFVGTATKAVSSVSLAAQPTKTQYQIGDVFDPRGLKLRVNYADGTQSTVSTGFTCSGFSSEKAGAVRVTVTFGGKSTSVTVTVLAKPSTTEYSFDVTYCQTEARSMLTRINALRTGSNAWYWDEDDTHKVYCSDLSPLVYDYELEKIAMQRAAEVVADFSHTRPNGESCFTAFTGTTTMCGENLSYGSTTAAQAQTYLEEADAKHAGQGHRRNMLSASYTAVGLACVQYNGRRFWVQEFRKPTSGTASISPCDTVKTVTVEVLDSNVESSSLTAAFTSRTLAFGDKTALPAVYNAVNLKTYPYNTLKCTVTPTWTSTNAAVAAVSAGNIVAKGKGTAVLQGNVAGENVSVSVTVTAKPIGAATVTLNGTSFRYNGAPVKPTVLSVKLSDGTVLPTDQYDVSYSNNNGAGVGKVTVTAKGNYSGTATATFEIYNSSSATVTWIVDGTTLRKTVVKSGDPIVKPADPTKDGYTFTGWTPAVPATMGNDDLVFTAVFRPVVYQAVFVADGVTVDTVDYTIETVALTEPAVPQKDGYIGQWESYTIMPGGMTIQAKYQLRSYTVQWIVDGKATKEYYLFGASIRKPADPVKDGYTFAGWTPAVPEKMPAANLTFSAVFIPNAVPSPTVDIRNYVQSRTVDYRTSITFTATVTNPVAGGTVRWLVDGKDAGTGDKLTVKEATGSFTVQAQYVQNGQTKAESPIETVNVNSGFLARLIAFFRGLFGALPTIAQEYLGVERTDV